MAMESKEERTKSIEMAGDIKKTSVEDKRALPTYTSETLKYVVECLTCRKQGLRRQYF